MRLASLDIGLKRIGVALCLDNSSALPQSAIIRKNRNQAANEVNIFVKEWKIERVIIGIAQGGDSEEEMSKRVQHFASLLEIKDIVFFDESFSSYEAMESMKGKVKFKKDGRLDSIAAAIILERYLCHLY